MFDLVYELTGLTEDLFTNRHFLTGTTIRYGIPSIKGPIVVVYAETNTSLALFPYEDGRYFREKIFHSEDSNIAEAKAVIEIINRYSVIQNESVPYIRTRNPNLLEV